MNHTSRRFLKVIPLILALVATLACPAFSEDIETLIKKAESGDPEAQLKLGLAHGKGEGVPKDDMEAVKWFRKAAEKGHADAQKNLGVSYYKGEGVQQDYMLAYFWISLSVTRSKGEKYYGSVRARDTASKKLTTEQLEKAQQMIREWEAKRPR